MIWIARGNVRRLNVPNPYLQGIRRSLVNKAIKKNIIIIGTYVIAWFPHIIFINGIQGNKFLVRMISVMLYVPVFIIPYLLAYRNQTNKREIKKNVREINHLSRCS